MNNEEYVSFLRSLLIKIENALNFMEQNPAKYILAYNKMLGVQQKLSGLNIEYRNKLFNQIIGVRGSLNYLINGHYDDAHTTILKLKNDLIKSSREIKNETNTDKKT